MLLDDIIALHSIEMKACLAFFPKFLRIKDVLAMSLVETIEKFLRNKNRMADGSRPRAT